MSHARGTALCVGWGARPTPDMVLQQQVHRPRAGQPAASRPPPPGCRTQGRQGSFRGSHMGRFGDQERLRALGCTGLHMRGRAARCALCAWCVALVRCVTRACVECRVFRRPRPRARPPFRGRPHGGQFGGLDRKRITCFEVGERIIEKQSGADMA